jgi:hypothetical protein
MDNRTMKRFVRLDKQRRDFDAKLKDCKRQIEELEPTVREQITRAGLDRVTIDGLTIFIKRDLWVKVPEGMREAACIALQAAGLGQYVAENFNSQSVSAYLREVESLMPDGQQFESCDTLAALEAKWAELPEEGRPVLPEAVQGLKESLGVSETFKVQTRLS